MVRLGYPAFLAGGVLAAAAGMAAFRFRSPAAASAMLGAYWLLFGGGFPRGEGVRRSWRDDAWEMLTAAFLAAPVFALLDGGLPAPGPAVRAAAALAACLVLGWGLARLGAWTPFARAAAALGAFGLPAADYLARECGGEGLPAWVPLLSPPVAAAAAWSAEWAWLPAALAAYLLGAALLAAQPASGRSA